MSVFSICEISPDYILDDNERNELNDACRSINVDPYRQYVAFQHQAKELIDRKKINSNLVDLFSDYARSSLLERPFVFVRNLPIDVDVPLFDNNRPVFSKYELKKTFVAEACLSIIAHLSNQKPIGYLNVNSGDVFQDIYPARPLSQTQSQKAVGPIYFHKDLANHFVRPDFVNMLGMRSTDKNEICTTFVKNIDVFNELSEAEIAGLRKEQFYTPFDDLTVIGGKLNVGKADNHPIVSGDYDIRFFENRTVGLSNEGKSLVERLTNVLHKVKKRVQMLPGDFIGVANNYSVHGKEVGTLNAPEEAWGRWTIKTVNVVSMNPHIQHVVPGTDYLIAG